MDRLQFSLEGCEAIKQQMNSWFVDKLYCGSSTEEGPRTETCHVNLNYHVKVHQQTNMQ